MNGNISSIPAKCRDLFVGDSQLQSLSSANDLANFQSHPLQAWNNWQAVKNRGIAEEYAEGWLSVDFVCMSRSANGGETHVSLCADLVSLKGTYQAAIAVEDSHIRQANGANSRNESVVLVEVVQFRDSVNPSVLVFPVSLKLSDEVDKFRQSTGKFAADVGIEIGLITVDGHSGFPSGPIAAGANPDCRQLIQCASEVMSDIADDGGTFRREGLAVQNVDIETAPVIRVFLDFNSVWVVAEKCLEKSLKISDVAVCPR